MLEKWKNLGQFKTGGTKRKDNPTTNPVITMIVSGGDLIRRNVRNGEPSVPGKGRGGFQVTKRGSPIRVENRTSRTGRGMGIMGGGELFGF